MEALQPLVVMAQMKVWEPEDLDLRPCSPRTTECLIQFKHSGNLQGPVLKNFETPTQWCCGAERENGWLASHHLAPYTGAQNCPHAKYQGRAGRAGSIAPRAEAMIISPSN